MKLVEGLNNLAKLGNECSDTSALSSVMFARKSHLKLYIFVENTRVPSHWRVFM